MLLFILYGYGRMEATTEFQYISCYSLSRKGMGYGTSGMRVSIHLMLLFIRISHFPNIFARIVSIHLMLLFILLGACNMFLSFCFNTSHVTLYRKSCCLSDARGQVSIHLMLLFISSGTYRFANKTPFQYISCYSLSFLNASSKVVV